MFFTLSLNSLNCFKLDNIVPRRSYIEAEFDFSSYCRCGDIDFSLYSSSYSVYFSLYVD